MPISLLLFNLTEEKISKLEKELENANDLLAAARQRGTSTLWTIHYRFSVVFKASCLAFVEVDFLGIDFYCTGNTNLLHKTPM